MNIGNGKEEKERETERERERAFTGTITAREKPQGVLGEGQGVSRPSRVCGKLRWRRRDQPDVRADRSLTALEGFGGAWKKKAEEEEEEEEERSSGILVCGK